jgi:hypothetical protein
VLFAEAIVLVLHVHLDVLMCVLLQQCSSVQEASSLSILYGDLWVTTVIDDSDGILVGLHIVCHKAFEVGLLHTIFLHEFVEFSPHIALDLVSSNYMLHTAMVMTL